MSRLCEKTSQLNEKNHGIYDNKVIRCIALIFIIKGAQKLSSKIKIKKEG